jgi:hypothetical protein
MSFTTFRLLLCKVTGTRCTNPYALTAIQCIADSRTAWTRRASGSTRPVRVLPHIKLNDCLESGFLGRHGYNRTRPGAEGLLRTPEDQIAYRAFRRKLDQVIYPRRRPA